MKKTLLILLIATASFDSFAQKVVVVDIVDKNPLSFVLVKDEQQRFYSDINGTFDLAKFKGDSLQVQFLGYKTRTISIKDIKDTIFLKQKPVALNKAVVFSESRETKKIKPMGKAWNFGSFPLSTHDEIFIVLYPKKGVLENSKIKKLIIPFEKNKGEKEELKGKGIKAYVMVHIYNVENNQPTNAIFNSKPVGVNAYRKDELKIDVSQYPINLTKSGLAIGLELIGYFNDEKKTPKNLKPYIRPALTAKSSDYFSAKTYFKFPFKNHYKIVPYNNLSRRGPMMDEKIHRNLNIGLVVFK